MGFTPCLPRCLKQVSLHCDILPYNEKCIHVFSYKTWMIFIQTSNTRFRMNKMHYGSNVVELFSKWHWWLSLSFKWLSHKHVFMCIIEYFASMRSSTAHVCSHEEPIRSKTGHKTKNEHHCAILNTYIPDTNTCWTQMLIYWTSTSKLKHILNGSGKTNPSCSESVTVYQFKFRTLIFLYNVYDFQYIRSREKHPF